MSGLRSARSILESALAWPILFLAVVAFYAGTFSFRNISDTDMNSYQTRALVLHGDVDLARYVPNIRSITPGHAYSIYRDGRLYSIAGVGMSLTVAPLYAFIVRMNLSDRALQAVASIPFVAVGALLLFRLLIRLFRRRVAVGTGVIYAFGTTMWPVAAMGFFMHGPASLYQAVGLSGLFSERRKAAAIAGLGFGAAGWVRPQLFIPLLLIGVLYLLEDRWKALVYAVAALPAIAGFLIQNRWLWGSWFATGYGETSVGWRGNVPHASYQLLFSWWRGLFIYSPVLLVGVFGALLAARRIRGFVERRMVFLALASVAVVMLYARRTDWTGGLNQFGYRYLLDIVPFLVLITAYGITRARFLRIIALPLGTLSVIIMAFGAQPNEFGWDGTQFPRDIEHTSLGQSWIAVAHRPLGAILRLAGVACIAGVMYLVASRSNKGSPIAEPTVGKDGFRAVPA